MGKNLIVGADYCPFCVKVYKYFKENNIEFTNVDSETAEGAKERTELSKKYNHNTIPIVIVNDKFIGGCNEFFNAVKTKQISF